MNNLKKNHIFHIQTCLWIYFSDHMLHLLAQDKDDTMPKKTGNICLCSSVYDLKVDQYAIRLKRNILTSKNSKIFSKCILQL